MGRKVMFFAMTTILAIAFLPSCKWQKPANQLTKEDSAVMAKINEFAVVRLTTDMSKLTENEKKMIPILVRVSEILDDLYWQQVIGNKADFLSSISDTVLRKFAEINYGPWERLNANKPFIPGYGEKPAGANFYPEGMTKEQFEKWNNPDKANQYTLVRTQGDTSLITIWYHEAYKDQVTEVAGLLKKAAELADDPGLKNYLNLRAEAFLTDDYFKSDMAWMDMKDNTIDFVVGPIENYEDELFGYKTAYETAILVKDKDWSKKLAKYSSMLPALQKQLPVDAKYKKEVPGTSSDLNAYDIIYTSGQGNAGGKTIAINLPNDEKVQLAKGSRRLQLKNAMKAKFENILVPIAGVVIDPSQRGQITFDAFFGNVMFHEVAHGLGIKNTITGKGSVREAMKEKFSAFEEAKADILGLFMVTKLIENGELAGVTKEQAYTTYMAGLIRSVRFGAADAHGKANMMCFNFFEDNKAFERSEGGEYKVNMENFSKAMDAWAAKVLMFEGDGDYEGASAYLEANGKVRPTLQADIDKLRSASIPVDIIYDQGLDVMGLKP